MRNRTGRLARLLLIPAALFALGCALLAPAEAGRAPAPSASRARRARQQEEARKEEKEPPADSTVRGRVVYEDTSRPVRRARVKLVGEGGVPTNYGALTDSRGEFQIRGVRAGSYVIGLAVPGVLSPTGFMTASGVRPDVTSDPDEARKFFEVVEVDGKEDVTVTVRARRGAAISGRVTYADGDAAAGFTVSLMRRGADGALERLIPSPAGGGAAAGMTDDRGQFRFTGLPPGEYFVAVTEAVEHGEASRVSDNDAPSFLEEMVGQRLLMSFHPSAAGVKEAEAVRVAAGEERADADIVIVERALHTVSGVVRSRRDGRPVPNARVAIRRRDDPANAAGDYYLSTNLTMHNAATTDDAGRFQFREIPDGAYSVSVRPPEEQEANDRNWNMSTSAPAGSTNAAPGPRRRRKGFAPARRELEVSGDVSDFAVELNEGGRVSGRITVEGEAAPPESAYVNLIREPEAGAPASGADLHHAQVEGGRFVVDGLPAGKFFVNVSAYQEDEKVYLKSLTWKGRDLLREPLPLGEGEAVEGVEIVFSRNAAVLRVRVLEGGKRVQTAAVLLLPGDVTEWRPFSGAQLLCWTDEDGACAVTAPPGEYQVVVLPQKVVRGAAGAGGFEAELKRRALTAPRVSLRAGETKELEVVAQGR